MNAKIKITYRDQDGNEILNPIEGIKAYSPETERLYIYTNNEWKMIEGDVGLNMNMYDMNKQIISQLPTLDEGALDIARAKIVQFIEQSHNKYFMMLCRELNYYTVFHIGLGQQLPFAMNEVIACADYLGDIKSIEGEEDKGAIEIWITQRENDKETYVMYLFPYDAGVIECTL